MEALRESEARMLSQRLAGPRSRVATWENTTSYRGEIEAGGKGGGGSGGGGGAACCVEASVGPVSECDASSATNPFFDSNTGAKMTVTTNATAAPTAQ
jgi:hypothetical protein